MNGLAEGQHRSGDPMTAISTYQKSLLNESDQPEVWISIGNIQYYNNLFPEATLSYQKSAELDSTNSKVYNNLGSVLKEQRKFDQAISNFKKAYNLDPKYALACRNLGDIYLRQGHKTEAVLWLKNAVKLDSENMRGQYWLGKAYYQAGEFVNAKNQYLRVLSKRPGLHSVHHDLGLAYFGMRHYGEAIDHVQQAIRANHSIYIYYLSLSRFFSSLHDETTALAVLDSAHQYDRSIPEIWIAKGDIHKSGERFEDALKAYQISSSYDSKNWKGYYKQGVVQYYLGRLNEALSSLELAHEIDSTQSEINHFLGLVHLKQEKVQMANFYLVKASMADGSNADILFHLGQSYSYLKKIQKALRLI